MDFSIIPSTEAGKMLSGSANFDADNKHPPLSPEGIKFVSGPESNITDIYFHPSMSRNSTSEIQSVAVSIVYPVFLLLLGIFGNLLALAVLACSPKRQRQSAFYTLVAGLAITDMVGTASTSPVPILVYSKKIELFENDVPCNFMGYAMVFFGMATNLILCSMSFERFIAFRHPYKYIRVITKKRTKMLVLIAWVGAGIISVLPFLGLGKFKPHYPSTWCFFDYHSKVPAIYAYVYIYTLFGLLSFFIILATNTIVVREILKMRRNTTYTCNIPDSQNNQQQDKDLEMIVVLIGVLVVQGVCWLPFLVLILIDQIGQHPHNTANVMAVRIASLNQIIDPWVYILFRKALFLKMKGFLGHLVRTRCKLQKLEESMANGKTDTMVRLHSRKSIPREVIELDRYADINGHSKKPVETVVVLKKNDMTSLLADDVNSIGTL